MFSRVLLTNCLSARKSLSYSDSSSFALRIPCSIFLFIAHIFYWRSRASCSSLFASSYSKSASKSAVTSYRSGPSLVKKTYASAWASLLAAADVGCEMMTFTWRRLKWDESTRDLEWICRSRNSASLWQPVSQLPDVDLLSSLSNLLALLLLWLGLLQCEKRAERTLTVVVSSSS